VDAWLDKAMQAQGREQRARLYEKVQKQMQSDQVYIPLWYEPVIAVTGPRLQGFVPAQDGSLLGLLSCKVKEI
jgi:peptide/nickel transport system substrate-binding protein